MNYANCRLNHNETSLRLTASGLDRSTGNTVLLFDEVFRCCWVAQDGLGMTGVSPVPPSISESKLKPGIPVEGVVIAMPAISCQLAEERGGGGGAVKGEATGSEVGRGLGAEGGTNSFGMNGSDDDSSLSMRSFLMAGSVIGIRLGMAGSICGLLEAKLLGLRIILHWGRWDSSKCSSSSFCFCSSWISFCRACFLSSHPSVS